MSEKVQVKDAPAGQMQSAAGKHLTFKLGAERCGIEHREYLRE